MTGLPASPRSAGVGIGLPALALVLPVFAGIVLFFVTSFGVSLAVSAATVLLTAILLAIDAHRLNTVEPNKQKGESAGLLLLGMIALWIVFYPFAYFRRRRFGGPNLAIPSVLVVLFFLLSPVARPLLFPPGLPACTSPEVASALGRALNQLPLGPSVKSIDGYRELDYDRVLDRRRGECVVHTDHDEIVVDFTVAWRDHAKGEFEVRTLPILPPCASTDVVQLLEKIIRGMPGGARVLTILDHHEISYDHRADRRDGECTVRTDDSDLRVKFKVYWGDREKGQFLVELIK